MVASSLAEERLLDHLSEYSDRLYQLCTQLKEALSAAPAPDGGIEAARYFRSRIAACQSSIAQIVSELESCTSAAHWPYPTYADILFSV